MDENQELRNAVNLLIDYCTNRSTCEGCCIEDFCVAVVELSASFCDCDGYPDDWEVDKCII